jgi:hypothetical protein
LHVHIDPCTNVYICSAYDDDDVYLNQMRNTPYESAKKVEVQNKITKKIYLQSFIHRDIETYLQSYAPCIIYVYIMHICINFSRLPITFVLYKTAISDASNGLFLCFFSISFMQWAGVGG